MIVSLVGNARPPVDQSDRIDSSDVVIRFNIPVGLDGPTGRRFDIWVLANGFAGLSFAKSRRFLNEPWRTRPSEIWFPRCAAVHKSLRLAHPEGLLKPTAEHDHGPEILQANALPQPARYIDEGEYRRAFGRLGAAAAGEDPTVVPSSGFVGLSLALDRYPDATFQLFGFRFSGWIGHPWQREKAFVLHMCRRQKAVLFDGSAS